MRTKTCAWRGSNYLPPVAESETHILEVLQQWNIQFILSINEINIFSQHESRQPENQLWAFNVQSMSGDHGLGTWLALKEDICIGAVGLPPICAEDWLETRISPNKRNELAVDLDSKWPENGHETSLATNDEIRVFALDVQHILLNIVSKHISLQAKNFVYFIST